MLMPLTNIPFTFTLVCTWYEESNPREQQALPSKAWIQDVCISGERDSFTNNMMRMCVLMDGSGMGYDILE